ncbi:MAG: hypothetical protein HN352_14190 [Bacteroidetes bacterium]|jgi:photosystem II stability/assembly factor-like uncharacterized protein|nr:hypothetical protein [Bacteroidota bacterium]MBT4400093.1 hypothetical protein [Bacteroidota bacterium]MBT5427634.1 hypothetical protein [Bacteroidota bacterium]MBT7464434.1 hypothetical protein [Bacteroidota bacterium]
MKRAFTLVLLAMFAMTTMAQKAPLTDGKVRLEAMQKQLQLRDKSEFKDLHWQFLGPTNLSGRATDVEAVKPKGSSYTIWVATASGGVWKTENEGNTWISTFDEQVTTDIGDLAIDPKNPEVVWVGTGEANIFRSSMAGCGIYKTSDGGKSWKNMGLENTNTIGRVVIHPENTSVVYVAASGNEWTTNPERGVYKTSDGGKSWKNILYIDEMTGANDLVMDPSDPNTLYACTWQRVRDKWNDPRTYENYSGTGIWKTTDGGKSWNEINTGLPVANQRGRIGIDIAPSNPDVLYILLDNYEIAYKAKAGQRDAYGRPKADVIKGATVYKSSNKGESWKKVSGLDKDTKRYMEGHSGTYGWVFAQIRVDPQDENKIYTMGLFLNTSTDGGKTFKRESRIHMDHHALWVDPDNPNYLLSGNDGGVYVSYDAGGNWKHFVDIPVIQFYNVAFDMGDPFKIYGSVQDHFSFSGEVNLSRGRDRIQPVKWNSAPGGEGSTHAVDPRDPGVVYSCGFYGSLSRTSINSRGRRNNKNILPVMDEGEKPLRGQWVAPFILSPHNPDIIYHGMQYVFRSRDRGNTWKQISPDLTFNELDKIGDISYQTLFALSESPLKFGLLYAGTDDGRLHITKNGGQDWKEILNGVPKHKWISRVIASEYKLSRVYMTQNGKRDDDFQIYVWKSEDFGENWEDISANIPLGPVNVIREDINNPDILYVGTDIGVYISKDQGKSWEILGDLPSCYVHDLVIQPRENIMIIATHGRGMFALDLDTVN